MKVTLQQGHWLKETFLVLVAGGLAENLLCVSECKYFYVDYEMQSHVTVGGGSQQELWRIKCGINIFTA